MQRTTMKGKADASTQQAGGGWTMQQLALVLMLFGVAAVIAAIKCLLLGPPPYSVLAYVIGPCLIAASYLVDPHASGDAVTDAVKSRGPLANRASPSAEASANRS